MAIEIGRENHPANSAPAKMRRACPGAVGPVVWGPPSAVVPCGVRAPAGAGDRLRRGLEGTIIKSPHQSQQPYHDTSRTRAERIREVGRGPGPPPIGGSSPGNFRTQGPKKKQRGSIIPSAFVNSPQYPLFCFENFSRHLGRSLVEENRVFFVTFFHTLIDTADTTWHKPSWLPCRHGSKAAVPAHNCHQNAPTARRHTAYATNAPPRSGAF